MNLNVAQDQKIELKKHVNAIHCTNNLTLVQRKLFNALLFNAYPDLPYHQSFKIKTRDLCLLIGYNSHDYAKLKSALIGLISIAIEWNVIDCISGKEKKWKASSILASAELANGTCIYEYSQIMKELFFQPEIYGRINIKMMSEFKSGYGLALYENCIRYQGLSQTPWFTLDIFRKLMGVFGNKYTVFKDFKKRVLNMAVDEVNALSPLWVSPEIERKNQQVTRIRFKFKKNKENENNLNHLIPNKKNDELEKILEIDFNLTQKSIKEILAQYETVYIKEKINFIMQSESFMTGRIRGLGGYLIQALKQDYKPNKSSQNLVEKRKEKVIATKLQIKQETKQQERYKSYVSDKINTFVNSLIPDEYEVLFNDFEKHIIENENSIIKGWFVKHKLEHPGIKACFNTFIKTNRQQELGNVLTYDEFIAFIIQYS